MDREDKTKQRYAELFVKTAYHPGSNIGKGVVKAQMAVFRDGIKRLWIGKTKPNS